MSGKISHHPSVWCNRKVIKGPPHPWSAFNATSREQACQVHLIGGCGHFVAAAALSEYRHVSVRISKWRLQIKLFSWETLARSQVTWIVQNYDAVETFCHKRCWNCKGATRKQSNRDKLWIANLNFLVEDFYHHLRFYPPPLTSSSSDEDIYE